MASQYEKCFMSPFWHTDFWDGLSILENLWTPCHNDTRNNSHSAIDLKKQNYFNYVFEKVRKNAIRPTSIRHKHECPALFRRVMRILLPSAFFSLSRLAFYVQHMVLKIWVLNWIIREFLPATEAIVMFAQIFLVLISKSRKSMSKSNTEIRKVSEK